MIVELDGVQHDFPDDATQDQIRQALSSYSGAKNSTISSGPATYMQMVEEGKEGCGANGLAAGHRVARRSSTKVLSLGNHRAAAFFAEARAT